MTRQIQLTFSEAPLGADQLAALDAYRARTALGESEAVCLEAAISAFLGHHPGMPRAEAATAVARALFEARRTLAATLDPFAFAAKRATRPGQGQGQATSPRRAVAGR